MRLHFEQKNNIKTNELLTVNDRIQGSYRKSMISIISVAFAGVDGCESFPNTSTNTLKSIKSVWWADENKTSEETVSN